MNIKEWQKTIREWAKTKGFFWETKDVDTMLLRIHSEVTEAGEAMRHNDFDNFKEECADIFIRLVDMCEVFGFDLEAEAIKKHEINVGRPYLHGKAKK